jgi:hypothetical protein
MLSLEKSPNACLHCKETHTERQRHLPVSGRWHPMTTTCCISFEDLLAFFGSIPAKGRLKL